MDLNASTASANAVLNSTLTDTIQRAPRVNTSDNAGGATVTFGTETTLAARVHFDTDVSAVGAGAEPSAIVFTIVVATDDTLVKGDRIRWVDSTGTVRTAYVHEVRESSLLIGRYAKAVETP